MTDAKRLNERATAGTGELKPLWHVDQGRALFAGPLNRNLLHAHSASVFLAGLYGTFGLRIVGGDWLTCRTAVIPAGVAYEFDIGGDPLCVFYLEPNIAGADALMPLAGNTQEVNGALIGMSGEISLLRELYEDQASRQWIGLALNDLLDFSKERALRQIDPRVSRVVEDMYESYGELTPVAELASSVGLSASRFQHLFTAEVGVPFRRYRSWHRLRAAIREVVNGSNFTQAAHAAGFSDQPHFARDFRRTFGAPPSPSLTKVRG